MVGGALATRARADRQRFVAGDLSPDVAERSDRPVRAAGRRGHAAHDLVVQREFCVVRWQLAGVQLEPAQLAVRVTAMVQARHRLLAGIAALREADVGRLEAGLGGEDPVVELLPPGRRTGLDAEQLQIGRLACELGVEHLDGRLAVVGGRDPVGAVEDDRARVLLPIERDLGGEARAQQRRQAHVAELGLREHQEVLLAAAPHPQRSDQPRLRRQQQRVARLADR